MDKPDKDHFKDRERTITRKLMADNWQSTKAYIRALADKEKAKNADELFEALYGTKGNKRLFDDLKDKPADFPSFLTQGDLEELLA